jgi:hypothetical protein
MRVRYKTLRTLRVILATGQVAVKGNLAVVKLSDGLAYAVSAVATDQMPIGRFAEALTGDGTETVLIDLFEETFAHAWTNDSAPNNVTIANLWGEVYIKDGTTVSTSSGSSTRSKAGRVIAIENSLIYVQAGLAVTGPSGLGASFSSGVATKAALSAIVAASRFDGMLTMVRADGSLWRFIEASTATEDLGQELVIEPDAGTGRWVAADKTKVLKVPVAYTDADGAAVLTVPTGMVLRLAAFPYWEVTTGFTGGTASAIGISTSVSGYATGGDILGGATGDVTATLGTSGIKAGTLGGELDDHVGFQALALVSGDELQFDRITSVFTAGAGFACIPVAIATA